MNTSTATDLVQDLATLQRRNEHLEEMQVRASSALADQAQLIADQKAECDQLRGQLRERDEWFFARIAKLENELNGARVIIEARDNRVVQLESALERRNGQLADATEAAEAYRSEVIEMKRVLRNIAELSDGALVD
jgi:chromosome segregation ATPase